MKQNVCWVKIKDKCRQTAIRLISYGVYSLSHDYPIKICKAIGYDNQELAVVIDTSLGHVDIPICIRIEDTETLSAHEVSQMEFLQKDKRDKICNEIISYLISF
jgi:hypothetical protein